VPRTQNRSNTSVRHCAACGYELSPGHDGPCPMCPRLDQLRADFTMPRPSELSASARSSGATTDVDSDAWPPTPSEYRVILAERRRRLSADAGTAATRGVIRTPGLVRAHPPGSRPESEHPAPEADAIGVAPPKSEKKDKPKGRNRRAERKRARARRIEDANLLLPVGPGPAPPKETATDAPREQSSDPNPPARKHPPPALSSPSLAAPRILPIRQHHSPPVRVAWWRVAAFALIIIVMSVLAGAAVSFMLPSP
jgi:hypothetical protein